MFIELKKITKAMAKTERKYEATNPKCTVRRSRLFKKYQSLVNKANKLVGKEVF